MKRHRPNMPTQVAIAVATLFGEAKQTTGPERELARDLGEILDELARFHRRTHDRLADSGGAS